MKQNIGYAWVKDTFDVSKIKVNELIKEADEISKIIASIILKSN